MYRVKSPVKLFEVEYILNQYIPQEVYNKIWSTEKGRELWNERIKPNVVWDTSASGEMPEIKEEDLI